MYDKNEALKILKYLNDLQDEVDFLRKPTPPKNRLELQSRLTTLKEKVKNDHKELRRKSSKGGLTEAEQLFLSTAIRQINSAFMIRTNTSPFSSTWNRGLQAIDGELSYFILKIEKELKKDA